MRTITTTVLDKAAFFTTFGAQIIEITGKYPDNTFILKVPAWVAAYEILGGWVPYNKFCNQRRFIKRKTRKLAGLPEYFTGGKDTGFKMGDIAFVRPFSKKEKERFASKYKS